MALDEARFREVERRFWATLGATPEERWVGLPSTGTRVRVQEVGEGAPILFVHGAQNAGTSWAPLAVRLAGHQCLLLDRPGCGLSPPVPGGVGDVGAFERLADTLIVDVLDGLSLDRAPVVATSLGGYHGLRSAAAHPDRIERLLLFGWSLGVPNEHLPVLMRLAGVRPLARLMTHIPVGDRAARALLARIGLRDALATRQMSDEGVDWYRALLNHTATARNELDGAPGLIDLRQGLREELFLSDELLGGIAVPVSFVWGADDPFGGADVAAAFVPRVPGATLEVVPGGHAVWMDDADRIATIVAALLSSRSPGGPAV